jgi:DNA-damage-inducible protein J
MANIQIQIDDDTKLAAESLFKDYGLNTESAVKIFITTALKQRSIPFPLTNNPMSEEEKEIIRQKRLDFHGCMKGKIWMADDFDAPLEDMKEYME